ncbi:hypothetical protein [Cytobacillus sp. IB215665]|uniref:hypothetical protein n=1 Tax=Cytobacillus sp. IB215665 TaxID=3097357 RepID=UPI002A0E85E7|nr:hypothetical protein [Cytobacillus sp. IB215665]MDX8367669.1 hypothetical protein [Cytobacillus sp. IB215665]
MNKALMVTAIPAAALVGTALMPDAAAASENVQGDSEVQEQPGFVAGDAQEIVEELVKVDPVTETTPANGAEQPDNEDEDISNQQEEFSSEKSVESFAFTELVEEEEQPTDNELVQEKVDNDTGTISSQESEKAENQEVLKDNDESQGISEQQLTTPKKVVPPSITEDNSEVQSQTIDSFVDENTGITLTVSALKVNEDLNADSDETESTNNTDISNESEVDSSEDDSADKNDESIDEKVDQTAEEVYLEDKKEEYEQYSEAFDTEYVAPNEDELSNIKIIESESRKLRQLTHEEALAYNPLHHVNTKRDSLILDAVAKERAGDPEAWIEYRKFAYKQSPYNFEIVDGKPVYNKFYYGELIEHTIQVITQAEMEEDEEKANIWKEALNERLDEFKNAPGQVPYVVGLNHNESLAKEYDVEMADMSVWVNPKQLWLKERKMWWDNPLFAEQPELLDQSLTAAFVHGTDINQINPTKTELALVKNINEGGE